MEHEDLRAVEVMIWFLYFENYPYLDDDPLDTENIIFGDSRFSLHIDVYALALKYGIPALAALAKKLFKKTLDTRFDNQLFVECIPIVYYINPVLDRGLHDLIVDYIKPNLSKLIEDKRSRAQYEALFRSFPQLMVDMIPEIYSCLSTNNPRVVIRPKLPEVDAKDIVGRFC